MLEQSDCVIEGQHEYFEDDVCVVGIQVQHTGEDGASEGSKVLANSLSSQ